MSAKDKLLKKVSDNPHYQHLLEEVKQFNFSEEEAEVTLCMMEEAEKAGARSKIIERLPIDEDFMKFWHPGLTDDHF